MLVNPRLVLLPGNRRFLRDYLINFIFYVGNNPIEYIDSVEHQGHVIMNQLTDNVGYFEMEVRLHRISP